MQWFPQSVRSNFSNLKINLIRQFTHCYNINKFSTLSLLIYRFSIAGGCLKTLFYGFPARFTNAGYRWPHIRHHSAFQYHRFSGKNRQTHVSCQESWQSNGKLMHLLNRILYNIFPLH